jgi:RNA polymerase sigma-70 factor (ECF subfamily)
MAEDLLPKRPDMNSSCPLIPCTSEIDPDARLMIRVQNGDEESFAILLNRNRNYVLQCLSRMVRNLALAEELVQDVFVRVYRARATYEPRAKFSTWIYRIAMNVALNYFRDEKRTCRSLSLDVPETGRLRREAADPSLLAEDRLLRDAVAEQVREAIRTLPAKQRAAVIMHKYEEMDYSEIAVALGCTASAVKAIMFRAHETLRIRLRHLNFDEVRANYGSCVVRMGAPKANPKPSKKPHSIAA